MKGEAIGLVLVLALYSSAARGRDDGAQSRPASAPASAPASKPASAPAPVEEPTGDEEKLKALEKRIEELRGLQAQLAAGERVSLDTVEHEFGPPPEDVDLRTRKVRDQVSMREEVWAAARAERERTLAEAVRKAVLEIRVGPTLPPPPYPHPLSEPDDLRLAQVRFAQGDYEGAAELLPRLKGAEARYLEARTLDSLNRLEEAQRAYKAAAAEARGNPRLLATIDRARRAAEWKGKFGRPEEFGAPLRPAPGGDK